MDNLKITTSNNKTNINNIIKFEAILGQFQCVEVEQKKNIKTAKLDHKIKFNGNTILKKEYDENEVFVGDLHVHVSDPWSKKASGFTVLNFVYQTFD